MMNILRHTDAGFAARLASLAGSSSLFDPKIEQRARGIVEAVQARGDAALIEFTERFDGAVLTAEQLAVSRAEIFNAALAIEEPLRASLAAASHNITVFARKSLRRSWQMRNSHGAVVGEKFDPFGRVGIYVPGGKAPLASTALMTITLARVSGCRQIVV